MRQLPLYDFSNILTPEFWVRFTDITWDIMVATSLAYPIAAFALLLVTLPIVFKLSGQSWLKSILFPIIFAPLLTVGFFAAAGLFTPIAAPSRPSTLPLRVAHLNARVYSADIAPKLGFAVTSNADIISFVEANPQLHKGLTDLKNLYPYQLNTSRDEHKFTMMLLSRWPVKLEKSYGPRAKLYSIEHATSPFHLLQIHPPSPHKPEELINRDNHLKALASDKLPRPLIVVGDMNTVPWDPMLSLLTAKASNPLTVAGPWLPTFPTHAPMAPIDHILTSTDIAPPTLTRVRVPSTDHLGLIADFPVLSAPTSTASPSIFVKE